VSTFARDAMPHEAIVRRVVDEHGTFRFYANSPKSIVGGMGIPAKHPRLLAVLNSNAISFSEALDRLRVSLSASAHLSSKGISK
jgi:hypothetical protein